MTTEIYRDLFIKDTPLMDVRAPVEFAEGHLPGAVNLAILNDDERAAVGTRYKQEGNAAAMELGHQLVSGAVKEARINSWKEFMRQHPTGWIYCFRGGQRSQITQRWLAEAGVKRPLIPGGYKQVRRFLLETTQTVAQSRPLLAVSGPTGSGKTRLLQDAVDFYPTVDLEGLAKHRGSAFGSLAEPQPTQVNFENQLAVRLLKLEQNFSRHLPLLVEDESRLIGHRVQPDAFFERLRIAPVIWIDESFETRVENIFDDYVLQNPLLKGGEPVKFFGRFKASLHAISRRLGGLRTQEVLQIIEDCEKDFHDHGGLEKNREWIAKLLTYYYDPLYLGSLERRQVEVAFRGSRSDCVQYLKTL